MRKPTKKPAPDAPPEPKTVGVPMQTSDLVALEAYRASEGRRTMVTPKQGPAALAIFRAGLTLLTEAGHMGEDNPKPARARSNDR